MFAVTGATGKVGGATARTLLAAGKSVRVIVRDRARAEEWSRRGCEIAVADSNNAAELAQALGGVEGAFVMLPPVFDPTPGFAEARAMIAALHAALAQARLAKVAVLSTIGAEASQPNLLNQLGLMEQSFADLPMPVTFLRAAWFMENAAWDVEPARNTGVIPSYLQPLDQPFPMIAAAEVGRTAAELLLEDWSGHRVVELEGPRRVSPNDVAQGAGLAGETGDRRTQRLGSAVSRARHATSDAADADAGWFYCRLDRLCAGRRERPQRQHHHRSGDRGAGRCRKGVVANIKIK
jgi:uncharacterized protein YbjT (DUF2867 family)